jgi:hypothetical protein
MECLPGMHQATGPNPAVIKALPVFSKEDSAFCLCASHLHLVFCELLFQAFAHLKK